MDLIGNSSGFDRGFYYNFYFLLKNIFYLKTNEAIISNKKYE